MYLSVKYDGSEADFYVDNQLTYTSKQLEKKKFLFAVPLPLWELRDAKNSLLIVKFERIAPKGWFGLSTIVQIMGEQTSGWFQSYSRPADHYVVKYGDDNYLIIPHKGLKHSIFKNGKQIGYWIKDYVSYEWSFVIRAYVDEDADFAMICQLIAAKIILCPESNDSNISVDFGNLGKELKPFDKNWTPKMP